MHKRDSLRSPRRLAMLKRRRLPYALTAQRHPVLPDGPEADAGRLCPECLEPVRLTQIAGESYYVHADDAPGCDLESPGWLRLAAAYVIFVHAKLHIEAKGPAPGLARSCAGCGATGLQFLPADLTHVDITCRHKRHKQADLVLYRGPRAACHLLVVEHMPGDLSQRAEKLDGPLVVSRAEEALLAPDKWAPAWSAGLRAWRCGKCG